MNVMEYFCILLILYLLSKKIDTNYFYIGNSIVPGNNKLIYLGIMEGRIVREKITSLK